MRNAKLITSLIGLGVLIILGHFWQWLPQSDYRQLINSSDFVNILTGGVDEAKVANFANKQNLKYQKFVNQHLSYSSDTSLPVPALVEQLQTPNTVIQPNQLENLRSTSPYQIVSNHHKYIYFPLSKDKNELYVIYRRVL